MEAIAGFVNNVGFPLLFTLGVFGTAIAVCVLIAEIATRKPKKHWALLWGPALFFAALIIVWGLINVLVGASEPYPEEAMPEVLPAELPQPEPLY